MFFIVRIVATHYVLTIIYYSSIIHGMDRIVQSVEKRYKKSDSADQSNESQSKHI